MAAIVRDYTRNSNNADQEEDMSQKPSPSVATRVVIDPKRETKPSSKAIQEAARDVATTLSKNLTASTILNRIKAAR